MRCELFLFLAVIGETLGPSLLARFLRVLAIVSNDCCDLGTGTETFYFLVEREKKIMKQILSLAIFSKL